MLVRIIQIITTIFILASFILQMIALLGNLPGLRSVYVSKVNVSSSAGGILANLLSNLPNYFTIGVFTICQGFYKNTANNICAPSSFGYNYQSTGLLQTVQEALPESSHTTLKGVQGGIFILSVCFCFIALLNDIRIYFVPDRGCFLHLFTFFVILVSLILSAAFFAVLVAVFYIVTNAVNDAKADLLGGSFGSMARFVSITTSKGPAIWIAMVAFILLFLACCLMLARFLVGRKARSIHKNQESYEMNSRIY